MGNENRPFTYAAECLLEINKNIGDVIDALLNGKVTKEDLEKWKNVLKSLSETHIEIVGAYIICGSAAEEMFSEMRKALKDEN